MRSLGDDYARAEFRRHAKCTPDEAKVFMGEWTEYAINLSKQLMKTNTKLGKNIAENDLILFTDEQLVQLYELSKATTGRATSNTDGSVEKLDSAKSKE